MPDPRAAFLADVLAGLAQHPKRLSSKYFYDARGSALFERICMQPEYYLTRVEVALMRRHVADIARALGPAIRLVEFGSGSGVKTRLLLEHLVDPVACVPVEISTEALADSVRRLEAAFPDVEILPVCADFTRPLRLPRPRRRFRRSVIYFPGSTLGNFDEPAAVGLLERMRIEAGAGGMALVGVDTVKDTHLLEAAYNDGAGVTAEFTLNLLHRIDHELGADFDVTAFAHRARWNPARARIETSIVSRRAQRVHIAGQTFDFASGEAMAVEISGKYTQASFARLAARAGWRVARTWHDDDAWFALHWLVQPDDGAD